MSNWTTIEVSASIEIDIERLVEEIKREYECEASEIDNETIREFIANHTTYMKGQDTSAIQCVEDGWNIQAVDNSAVKKIMDYIAQINE